MPCAAVPMPDQRREATSLPNGPDVVGRDNGQPIQHVADRSAPRVGARNDPPCAAVPVLDQRPVMSTEAGDGASHCPDVTGGDDRHCIELVSMGCGIRTGNNPPFAAIPVLDQCSGGLVAIVKASHRPDIVYRDRRYPMQRISKRPHIRTGNNAPASATGTLSMRENE